MQNDEFILGQGLGHQLELAFRRNGWSTADVHALCKGDLLARLRQQMLKPAEPIGTLSGILERNPLFEPWKTITIGTRTADELIRALLDEEYVVDDEAQKILREASFATQQTEVTLVNLTHKDLGYEDGEIPHYSIVCRHIRHLGFSLCTPEIAATLRLLTFDDQNQRPVTFMAMAAVEGKFFEQYLNDEEGSLQLYTQDVSEVDGISEIDFVCVIPAC